MHAGGLQVDFFDIQTVFLAQANDSFSIQPLLPFILIFLVIYLLIIRPQAKRQQMSELKKRSLQKGDNFITSGGLLAKAEQFKDDGKIVVASLGTGVKVEVVRNMIYDVLIDIDKKGNRLGATKDNLDKDAKTADDSSKSFGSGKKKPK